MGFADRVLADWRRAKQRAWPAGPAVVEPWDEAHGHDDELYVPEEYEQYLVTSNEFYAAAQLRARLASTVPLRVYKGRTEDKKAVPDSAAAQLLDSVNPFWTQARLARMDELSMCIFGETYWAVEKDELGRPKEIWWLKASRVKPVPHPTGYLQGFLYESNMNGQVIPFKADEIVWFRYPNPLDEFSAMSPVAAARLAADTGSAMMQANRNLHKQGVQIAGMVVPKGDRVRYTKEQAKELADDLEKRFAGTKNAHRWAVLRYEAEFKPVTMTPKDAEWVLGLGLTLRQVCNALSIPSPLLNDLEHATLANLREFQKALWEHGLVPDLTLRGQEIEEQFLPLFKPGPGRTPTADHVEHDYSRVAALQESQSATWDRDRQAIEIGALKINEWRSKHGMPAVDWGDTWWAPVNKTPVEEVLAGADESGGSAQPDVRGLTEMVQKIYLGVGTVLTWREAREILNRAGAGLDLSVPEGGEEQPDEEAAPEPVGEPAVEDADLGDIPRQWRAVLAAMEADLRVNGHGGHR